MPHVIKFSDARRIGKDTYEIRIYDDSASTFDELIVLVKNGRFSSRYRTVYPADPPDARLLWITTKQRLVLNQKTYRKGETIRGRIEFECIQEAGDPRHGEKDRRTIRIVGPFKPIVE